VTRERTSLARRLLGLLVHNASELRFERDDANKSDTFDAMHLCTAFCWTLMMMNV
jgi:hypothetical protein